MAVRFGMDLWKSKHSSYEKFSHSPLRCNYIFLIKIYQSLPNTTVVNDCISKKVLLNIVKSHDRIFVLGHGSSKGLFNPDTLAFLIDTTFSKVLKDKVGFYIFCHADKFVFDNKLTNCFYSGMFISDVWELPEYNQEIPPKEYVNYTLLIDESNQKFATQLGKLIIEKEFNLEAIFKGIKEHYGNYATNNEIAAYNCDRLYYNPKKI
jgi:hypothetical protein